MLGTVSVLLRGIPFIYQGQEIGMQNARWNSVDEFDDISTKDQYRMAREAGLSDAEALADAIFALKQKLGLRCDLKDLHLEEEQIAELVKISRHPNLYNNPVEITDEMLDKMYRYLAN